MMMSGVSFDLMNALAMVPDIPIPSMMVSPRQVPFVRPSIFPVFHDAAVHGLFHALNDDPVIRFQSRQDLPIAVVLLAGPDQAVGDDPLAVHGIDAGQLSLFDDGGLAAPG